MFNVWYWLLAGSRRGLRCCVFLVWVVCLWAGAAAADKAKPAAAPEVAPTTPEQLTDRIRALAETHDAPAFSLALVDNNQVVWQHSEGMADRDKGIESTNDTLYRIGSVSKIFVGLSVLKLVEEGKLDLYAKVRDLAPNVAFENPWEATHPVRVIHLLEHTTGWDDMHLREYSYEAHDDITLAESLSLFPDSRKARWKPGTRHAYCNTGPVVAAHIVERITGMAFEDYVQTHFFNPLQMKTATFFKPNNYDTHSAKVYYAGKHQPYWKISARPSGSINASLHEMTNFLTFLMNKGQFNGEQIISPAVFDQLERAHTQIGVEQGVQKGYGLTMQLEGYKGLALYGHGGAVMGGMTFVLYNRELGEGFVLMMTGDGVAFFQALELVKGYLARSITLPSDWQAIAENYPLPNQFKQLDGWYKPINSRTTRIDLLNHLVGAHKFWHEGNVFHRSPLLESWVSNEIAYSEQVLTDTWTTLPTVAVTTDPIAGEVVQVGEGMYKKVSTLAAFGYLGAAACTLLISVVSVLVGLFWLPFRLVKKRMGLPSSKVMLAPTLTSLSLIVYVLLPMLVGTELIRLATVNGVSVLIMLASIVYPVCTLWAFFRLFTLRRIGANKFLYVASCILVMCHVWLAIYLASFGWLFYRSWLT